MTAAIILIVVDRPEQRRRFNLVLSDSEHRLVYTFDGEDAFDRFAEVRPDLVIVYERTPRLDGPLLCQLIRRQGGADTPIVLLVDDEVSEERLRAMGADAGLRWPFEHGDVLPLVEQLLAHPPRHPSFPPARASRPAAPTAAGLELDLTAEDTTSLDLADSTLSSVFLDDDTGQLVAPVENQDDASPTSPGEEPLLASGLLEEPIAPMGSLEPSADEITSVQIDPQLLAMLDETERAMLTEEEELPLVSPVAEDAGEDSAQSDALDLDAASELAGTTSDTARKRALLEEPPLPGPDQLGAVEFDPTTEAAERPPDESLIAELPKEGTPTGARGPTASARRDAGKVGRGLDESQLGRRLIRRVAETHRVLGELDHYQVLGLDPGAERRAIDDAYFELSIEFHPDRFFLLRAGELKRQIFEIYARLEQAYAVLSDPDARAAHDRARNPTQPPAETEPPAIPTEDLGTMPEEGGSEALLSRQIESAVPAAQTLIELARGALDDEDRNGARLYLSMALGADPANERLRALLEAIVARGSGLRPLPPVP